MITDIISTFEDYASEAAQCETHDPECFKENIIAAARSFQDYSYRSARPFVTCHSNIAPFIVYSSVCLYMAAHCPRFEVESMKDAMMIRVINGFEMLPHEVTSILRYLAEQAPKQSGSGSVYWHIFQPPEAVSRLCRAWTLQISQAKNTSDDRYMLSYACLQLSVVDTLSMWKKPRLCHMCGIRMQESES